MNAPWPAGAREFEQRASNRSSALRGQASPPGHEALIVARAASAGDRGTVWIEGLGAARSDGLTLWGAARGFLFLGRGRCRRGAAKDNDSGKRKSCPD